jgi:hypothetical protein
MKQNKAANKMVRFFNLPIINILVTTPSTFND